MPDDCAALVLDNADALRLGLAYFGLCVVRFGLGSCWTFAVLSFIFFSSYFSCLSSCDFRDTSLASDAAFVFVRTVVFVLFLILFIRFAA